MLPQRLLRRRELARRRTRRGRAAAAASRASTWSALSFRSVAVRRDYPMMRYTSSSSAACCIVESELEGEERDEKLRAGVQGARERSRLFRGQNEQGGRGNLAFEQERQVCMIPCDKVLSSFHLTISHCKEATRRKRRRYVWHSGGGGILRSKHGYQKQSR